MLEVGDIVIPNKSLIRNFSINGIDFLTVNTEDEYIILQVLNKQMIVVEEHPNCLFYVQDFRIRTPADIIRKRLNVIQAR